MLLSVVMPKPVRKQMGTTTDTQEKTALPAEDNVLLVCIITKPSLTSAQMPGHLKCTESRNDFSCHIHFKYGTVKWVRT